MKKLAFLFLMLPLLTACTDTLEENDSQEQTTPVDPGTGYTEQTVSVYRDGKDGGMITLRFYDDMPNVAYIAASAYYQMMLPNATMTVVNKGSCYELTAGNATATVDVKGDVLTSDSYDDFVSLMSLTAPGLPSFETCNYPFLKFDSHLYEPAGATVTLNFGKYGIDLRDDGRDTYFPFATINDLFTDADNHIACYDGSRVLVNTSYEGNGLEDIDADFAAPAFKTVEVGEDLATFRYAELCFVIDNFYGYPDRTILEKHGLREKGMDATLDAVSGGKDVKQLLRSRKQMEFIMGVEALAWLMDDGGHTVLRIHRGVPQSIKQEFDGRYDETLKTIPEAARQMIDTNEKYWTEYRTKKNELKDLRKAIYGDNNIYMKSQDGQTAMFLMDSFSDVNGKGWRTYYASNHTAEDWQRLVAEKTPDLLVQTVETLKRARREGVRNLILDLSLNGGGDDDPTTTIVALFGDKTAPLRTSRRASSWEMNMLTRQFLTKTYLVDRNFDGKFDELDDQQDWVGDMNVVLLISEMSFSNCTVFSAKMKEYGYPIWGRKTNGGACSVINMVTADGISFRLSSYRSLSTYSNKQSVDGGTPVEKQLTDEQMYDIEYLNALFK